MRLVLQTPGSSAEGPGRLSERWGGVGTSAETPCPPRSCASPGDLGVASHVGERGLCLGVLGPLGQGIWELLMCSVPEVTSLLVLPPVLPPPFLSPTLWVPWEFIKEHLPRYVSVQSTLVGINECLNRDSWIWKQAGIAPANLGYAWSPSVQTLSELC